MPYADVIPFALAVLICAVGVAALAGHALRPPPKDRLLLWVGIFSLCYGVRLLVNIGAIGGLVLTRPQGAYADWAINYAIVVPAILFGEEVYGKGWRNSLRWLAVATGVYAVVGFAVDLATHTPGRAPDPALVVLAPGLAFVFAAGAWSGYRPKPFPEWRLLVVGFVVFMLFVLHEHAVAAGLLPWRVRIEPLGMLFFNACLALIAVSRFFTNQRQLIAVEKEMEAARQIQSSILPRELPSIRGLDSAVRYEPLAAVAGDFYDVVATADGAMAALVADVSGHGVPAALIASMVKVAFAAEVSRSSDPAAILAGMNATLCGMFDRACVTAVCAIVQPSARTLTYAVAGHPPPVLVAADGTAATLDERGMFIGMFPTATYASATVPIEDGARLLLYTDGVTEAADPATDDLFGLDRLLAFARAGRHRPARAFADALLAEVTAFARRDPLQHDAVTVVVVDAGSLAG